MAKKLRKRNFRDLSYLQTKDGYRLKEGIFFRCSHLFKLSKKEKEEVLALHLHSILDLRTDGERMKKPDEEGLAENYLHFPFVREATLGITHEKGLKGFTYPPKMKDLYALIATDEESKDGLSQALRFLLKPNGGNTLWHCSAGKDRAGILAALFLLLLGYEEEDILRDYELSDKPNRRKGRLYQALILILLWRRTLARGVYEAMRADREYLLSAFSAIKSKYGSYERYFKNHLGIDEGEIKTFKKAFMVKA